MTIFFDEVQNLFQEETGELALFQHYVDDFKRKQYRCLIVFCGSVRTLLHKILFDEHSPLYGRIDQKTTWSPLGFMCLGISLLIMQFINRNSGSGSSVCSAQTPVFMKFSYNLISLKQPRRKYLRKAGWGSYRSVQR